MFKTLYVRDFLKKIHIMIRNIQHLSTGIFKKKGVSFFKRWSHMKLLQVKIFIDFCDAKPMTEKSAMNFSI